MKQVICGIGLIYAFFGFVVAQSSPLKQRLPYIEFYDCLRCDDQIILIPPTKYPGLVGTGPNNYNGLVSIQVIVGVNGDVEMATAIAGHPYFRPIVETAAFGAKFRPTDEKGNPIKRTVVLRYQVVSTARKPVLPKSLPVLNGMASYLPRPEYPNRARRTCANGPVEVEILINRSGRVQRAKAINGERILHRSAVRAASRARFGRVNDMPPIELKGILRYVFQYPQGCSVRLLSQAISGASAKTR